MAKNGHSEFFPKRLVQIWNGYSKFFLTIFPKNTGINLEWLKMGILNLFKPFLVQKDWKKFRIARNGYSKFIQTFLVQKDWKKFGMAKIRHSIFIQTCNGV